MVKTVIPTDDPVLVTGATGYVAGQIVMDLMAAGVVVHGTVRSLKNKLKYQHLLDLPGTFKPFEANLLKPKSFAKAMEGCSVVFHTASPFPDHIKDPYIEVVAPAVEGTKNVLIQANMTPSVKRVVVTSSNMAMFTDALDVIKSEQEVLDESCWNTTASLKYQPYAYSKSEAEKAAWDMSKEPSTQWDLVVINPGLVLGPGVKCHVESQSVGIVKSFADGTFKSGAPRLAMACVDIREVSKAHLEAAFRSEAKGRYLVCHHETDFFEMTQILRAKYPMYDFPKTTVPKPLLWAFGPFIDSRMNRKFVSRNVGHRFRVDSSKSQKELGIQYRPLSDSLCEMLEQIVAEGLLDETTK